MNHGPLMKRRLWLLGCAGVAVTLPTGLAEAQSISLNFNFGMPGYHVGFWAPSPYYRRYYSPELYAQYVMWYYYPSYYYRYYFAPPPPPPPGIPRPARPPYGAPRPPPPDRFFSGLRVPPPRHYPGAPYIRPGGPIPHWRPAFEPPGGEHYQHHDQRHGQYQQSRSNEPYGRQQGPQQFGGGPNHRSEERRGGQNYGSHGN